MSIARREAKWISASLRCAAQTRPPEQRQAAAPSSRSSAEPHTGQCAGMCQRRVCAGRCSGITRTTSGITSPARRTITVSPTRTSSRATWSALCSVALVTVTPATCTGASRATGVAAPVRPIWISIASTVVVCSCAGNLCAMAQRGARATKPIVRCPS